jgi:hypothetical protein
MKNLHLLPTDKPSRLHLESNGLKLSRLQYTLVAQNIYITNSEEIKEGDDVKDKWVISEYGFVVKADRIENNYLIHSNGGSNYLHYYKFIILTTDQDLIKDGVQAIPDEFLEWFVKNPSCEEVGVEKENICARCHSNDVDECWSAKECSDGRYDKIKYKIYNMENPKKEPKITNCSNKNCQSGVINGVNPKICRKCNPKEESKQETLEEVKDLTYYRANAEEDYMKAPISVLRYISELEKRSYSEEEVLDILRNFYTTFDPIKNPPQTNTIPLWFENFKKK